MRICNYVQVAFDAICKESSKTESWYVSLIERVPFYGGPEEGGWWGSDTEVIAYQRFVSEELANEAAAKVNKLAAELCAIAREEYERHCLRQPDWLGEVAGETEYFVTVTNSIPEPTRGCRHYE